MLLSVIVPVLDEAPVLAETLRRARQPRVQIIVVDGGSKDDSAAIAADLADLVLHSKRGRAAQMNAGAARASGDVLLFLHADTHLPEGYVHDVIDACSDPAVGGGRFDVELTPSSLLLWITAELINRRSRLTKVATGDQAMFVRRDVFEALGGFAQIPLMEDLDFSRRLKRVGEIACLRRRVTTSARRWQKDGPMRTILLMWSLRLLYYAGVEPERLSRFYRNTR
jgi:rSAM/selenodomain-associated transferase 2